MVAMTLSGPHAYRLFGLNLVSDLAFPELASKDGDKAADVDVRLGHVPPSASGPSPEPIEGGAVITVPYVARYAVLEGRRIIVDCDDGADPRNVRLYLLGSAMGLLLHQRGILPLHANAVEIDGQAFAFMGPSGAGKSTLAAWFHDRGLRVVADDVCAVHFDVQSRPWVSQGLPRLRLWKSALEATGRSDEHFQRSYAGDEQWDKYDVPLMQPDKASDLLPLAAIYLLSEGEEFAIEGIDGVAAADAIFANTYRGQYIDGGRQARNHWESSLKLIAAAPLFSVSRLWGFAGFDEQARRIIDHAEGIARQSVREAG
jgi:hypothetical protein